jgi:hypothetical protein
MFPPFCDRGCTGANSFTDYERKTPVTVQLTKDQKAMIAVSAHGLNGAEADNFENAVVERLTRLMDSGVTHVLGKNHIRAAITAELAAGK